MENQTIIFVCEHGAAKSVVASAYFNKLAAKNGLGIRSIARGTHPDSELSPIAVAGLANDGLIPAETSPIKLSISDLDASQHMVAFCNLADEEYHRAFGVEHWDDIPNVSDGYEAARDAIVHKIEKLIEQLNS